MNLNALANSIIIAITPNFIGTLMSSAGYGYSGDASFTAAIAGVVMTVSATASGSISDGSVISGPDVVQGTTVTTALGGGSYVVTPAQMVASETMTAVGTGKRTSQYVTTAGLQMQVQAVSADDLEHTDGLNISAVNRAVYVNTRIQGANRPGINGGDLLLIPTGLTSGQAMDTWLVVGVPEGWDSPGWTKCLVTLQAPGPPPQ